MSRLPPITPPPSPEPSGPPRIAVQVRSYPVGQSSKVNVWAYAAIVAAVAACVPLGRPLVNVLVGLGAAAAGAMAIHQANDPRYGGRRLGTLALVFSVFVAGFWLLGGQQIYGLTKETEAPALLARQFLRDLSTGDLDSARGRAAPLIPPPEMQAWVDTVQPLGALEDFTAFNRTITDGRAGGIRECSLSGTARFAQDTRAFEMTLVYHAGTWRVTDLRFP